MNSTPCKARLIVRTAVGVQAVATGEYATAGPYSTAGSLQIPDPPVAYPEIQGNIITTFRWPAALGGQSISVTGSYCGWSSFTTLARSAETDDYMCSLPLPPGLHQYKYQVDGKWGTSPCEPTTIDNKGRRNHHRVVAASAQFIWAAGWGGKEVLVTGSFAGWSELIPLTYDAGQHQFHVACSLTPGVYSYQFLVDGRWVTSPDAPIAKDDAGHLCNTMEVRVPPAFHIFYATGWQHPVLHYCAHSSGQPPLEGWQTAVMSQTSSRARPAGGLWNTAIVPVPQDMAPSACMLDFHISGETPAGASGVDRPGGSGSYACQVHGGFKLQKGRMLPFPRAQDAPLMVVSDLDGTMVGESPAADAATAQFCEYWENTAALAGGVLVYNTGRSLGQFQELLASKAAMLALPNALITAVGTKVFILQDRHAGGEVQPAEHEWVEDLQWAARLSQGWHLPSVREVANQVIAECGGEGGAHWLDSGTEHPHRIALSVQASCVPSAVAGLQQGCHARGLQVQVIVSGIGDWRYVDCVSNQGGKLQALEYVRSLFNIPRSHCVSAGDSGNDILMLQGSNPGIIVGNSQPELLDWLATQPQDGRLQLTDAPFAHGILEGLARHGLR